MTRSLQSHDFQELLFLHRGFQRALYDDLSNAECKESLTMKCNEIMSTDLKVCTGEDSAVNVAKMMKEKDVGPIPVVTKTEMELVGIVTDRDIVLRVLAEGKDPNETK